MITDIFSTMGGDFRVGVVIKPVSYYFSIGEVRQTVLLTSESCQILPGKAIEVADCVCKMQEELFLRIWQHGYQPGLKDFLTGAIKSNDPEALKTFLVAFGKG